VGMGTCTRRATYGTRTTALSTALFNGASCEQCYKTACDRKRANPMFCKPGVTVTITATNLCPPNYALPGNNGGWCNPRPHFDMAQPAWEKTVVYNGGIIQVIYKRCIYIFASLYSSYKNMMHAVCYYLLILRQ